jgi:hypothetical protein
MPEWAGRQDHRQAAVPQRGQQQNDQHQRTFQPAVPVAARTPLGGTSAAPLANQARRGHDERDLQQRANILLIYTFYWAIDHQ